MSITPVNNTASLAEGINTLRTDSGDQVSKSFLDVFKNAVNDVNETDAAAKQSEMLAALGETDDLHTLMINITKADMALQTMVQIRNKALDAYNEIMKITL